MTGIPSTASCATPQWRTHVSTSSRSSVVAVTTHGDQPRDWVLAGMALEGLLLRASAAGVVATFADQATQIEETRSRLAEALDVLGHPQIVLRLGYPLVDVDAPPRRPLENLLLEAGSPS